jgi:hypothetical protein
VVPAHPAGRVKLVAPAFDSLRSGEIEAQFEIAADGSATVTLLKKTGDAEADRQVLESLRTIEWVPKTVGGIPVADLQTLDFSVQN